MTTRKRILSGQRKFLRPRIRRRKNDQESEEVSEEPISLIVTVDKSTYQAGSQISGKIFMFVPQSATGCTDFSGIHLSLKGLESIKLEPGDSDFLLFPPELHQKEVTNVDAEVVPLSSPLSAGQFEYPFHWKLPENSLLPSSMRCVTDDGSACQVQYNLTAYLATSNSELSCAVATCKQSICIAGNGLDSDIIGSRIVSENTVEPKRFKVKSFLRNKGSIELGIDTDTVVTSSNSKVTVGITGRNISSVPVEELLVQWVETLHLIGENEHERKFHRVLAETRVPCDALPPSWQVQSNDKKKSMGASRTTSGEESSIPADRITAKLHLKNNGRDSYMGQMIHIQHALHVTAMTKGKHVTKPKCTVPMTFQRKIQSDGSLSSAPIALAQAQLSPFSDDDDENDSVLNHNPQIPCNLGSGNIAVPQAVPISLNIGVDHDATCLGEMEQNQSCSTLETGLMSSSFLDAALSTELVLQPLHVMTVEVDE